MDTEKLIQDYIADRLSKKEIDYVENLIETDYNFKVAFNEHKNTTEAFKILESKLIKNRFNELENKNKSRFKINKALMATAVVALVTCLFYINLFTKSNTDIYNSYFDKCPNTYFPITRGNNIENLKFKAFKAYENNEFKTSETFFNQLLKKEDNLSLKFYYAMSLLNQEKTDLALNQLLALKSKSFDYQIESLWYSCLIYIKKEDIINAQKNAKLIQQLNPDFKTKEVETILNR